MTESTSDANFSQICVLVRAAHFLGLHREQLALHVPSDVADAYRILWWSIQSLDIGYSLAHALPPLTHATQSDVQILSGRESLARRLLITLIQVNLTLSKVLESIYGIQKPTNEPSSDSEQSYAKKSHRSRRLDSSTLIQRSTRRSPTSDFGYSS